MKKDLIYKILFALSLIFVILFIVTVIVDFSKYDALISSAPFSVDIMFRVLEFAIPSVICFTAALVLKNRKGLK